eukprot:TRINITY_DN578_c0_g1_i3.p2 TRINITY_DN578_c0_g1~~TRINITY_DN578_c0_g1_i3.p2  ORF type:complete len:398 (+),score=27.74 TRINITY_DN578_c0_g1_i3:88-1281(+)
MEKQTGPLSAPPLPEPSLPDQFDYVDDDIHNELLCAICQNPFVEPVTVAACEHTFCKTCLSAVRSNSCPNCRGSIDELEGPDRTLRKLLRGLTVYCSRKCGWTGERSDLLEHLSKSCKSWACPDHQSGCKVVDSLPALTRHIRVCDFRKIKCSNASDGCVNILIARELKAHLSVCPVVVERKKAEEARETALHVKKIQQEQEAILLSALPPFTDFLELNVSGTIICVVTASLTQFPESLLTQGFAQYAKNPSRAPVRVNRSVRPFTHMLDWIKNGWLSASLNSGEIIDVYAEARFWGVLAHLSAHRTFYGLSLREIDFRGCGLTDVDLESADLNRALLQNAILATSNLSAPSSFLGYQQLNAPSDTSPLRTQPLTDFSYGKTNWPSVSSSPSRALFT